MARTNCTNNVCAKKYCFKLFSMLFPCFLSLGLYLIRSFIAAMRSSKMRFHGISLQNENLNFKWIIEGTTWRKCNGGREWKWCEKRSAQAAHQWFMVDDASVCLCVDRAVSYQGKIVILPGIANIWNMMLERIFLGRFNKFIFFSPSLFCACS